MIVTKTSQVSPSTDETPTIQVAGRKIKARYSLSKLEGGKFSLKLNSTDKRILEGASEDLSGKPDNISTSSKKHTFLKTSTHAEAILVQATTSTTTQSASRRVYRNSIICENKREVSSLTYG